MDQNKDVIYMRSVALEYKKELLPLLRYLPYGFSFCKNNISIFFMKWVNVYDNFQVRICCPGGRLPGVLLDIDQRKWFAG